MENATEYPLSLNSVRMRRLDLLLSNARNYVNKELRDRVWIKMTDSGSPRDKMKMIISHFKSVRVLLLKILLVMRHEVLSRSRTSHNFRIIDKYNHILRDYYAQENACRVLASFLGENLMLLKQPQIPIPSAISVLYKGFLYQEYSVIKHEVLSRSGRAKDIPFMPPEDLEIYQRLITVKYFTESVRLPKDYEVYLSGPKLMIAKKHEFVLELTVISWSTHIPGIEYIPDLTEDLRWKLIDFKLLFSSGSLSTPPLGWFKSMLDSKLFMIQDSSDGNRQDALPVVIRDCENLALKIRFDILNDHGLKFLPKKLVKKRLVGSSKSSNSRRQFHLNIWRHRTLSLFIYTRMVSNSYSEFTGNVYPNDADLVNHVLKVARSRHIVLDEFEFRQSRNLDDILADNVFRSLEYFARRKAIILYALTKYSLLHETMVRPRVFKRWPRLRFTDAGASFTLGFSKALEHTVSISPETGFVLVDGKFSPELDRMYARLDERQTLLDLMTMFQELFALSFLPPEPPAFVGEIANFWRNVYSRDIVEIIKEMSFEHGFVRAVSTQDGLEVSNGIVSIRYQVSHASLFKFEVLVQIKDFSATLSVSPNFEDSLIEILLPFLGYPEGQKIGMCYRGLSGRDSFLIKVDYYWFHDSEMRLYLLNEGIRLEYETGLSLPSVQFGSARLDFGRMSVDIVEWRTESIEYLAKIGLKVWIAAALAEFLGWEFVRIRQDYTVVIETPTEYPGFRLRWGASRPDYDHPFSFFLDDTPEASLLKSVSFLNSRVSAILARLNQKLFEKSNIDIGIVDSAMRDIFYLYRFIDSAGTKAKGFRNLQVLDLYRNPQFLLATAGRRVYKFFSFVVDGGSVRIVDALHPFVSKLDLSPGAVLSLEKFWENFRIFEVVAECASVSDVPVSDVSIIYDQEDDDSIRSAEIDHPDFKLHIDDSTLVLERKDLGKKHSWSLESIYGPDASLDLSWVLSQSLRLCALEPRTFREILEIYKSRRFMKAAQVEIVWVDLDQKTIRLQISMNAYEECWFGLTYKYSEGVILDDDGDFDEYLTQEMLESGLVKENWQKEEREKDERLKREKKLQWTLRWLIKVCKRKKN